MPSERAVWQDLPMISLALSLRHMAWSNQKFFGYFTELPDEVFGLSAAEGEWPVGQLLTHFAGSGQWYRYCLGGADWSELTPVTTGAIARQYLEIMAELDAFLLEHVDRQDEALVIDGEDGPINATRSLILSQAVMHSAEHKGQIAEIMRANGWEIALDPLDVWSYVAAGGA